jgi:hypothetical protein
MTDNETMPDTLASRRRFLAAGAGLAAAASLPAGAMAATAKQASASTSSAPPCASTECTKPSRGNIVS